MGARQAPTRGELMFHLPPGKNGVLPNQLLEAAIDAKVIFADEPIPAVNVQPASLDLRLGSVAYGVGCSFLPGNVTVEERLRRLAHSEIDISGGAVLALSQPYIIPLQESLDLPGEVRGKANPKSSTGRADVFTRVLTDGGHFFDEVRAGYRGPLYLEVVPLSFPVRVQAGLALNQLRLSVGRVELSDDDIRLEHASYPMLFDDGFPIEPDELAVADGLLLGLDLRGDRSRQVGYRARKNAYALDLTRPRGSDPALYWDPARRDKNQLNIVLDPDMFYLLMSKEAVRIPPGLAAEMTAYDPTSGELRTHYAGFFDPGFGYSPDDSMRGSTAALEVRAHDVAFMIEHGQRVCKLTFERMLAAPTRVYGQDIKSNYQGQSNTLGKHFKLPKLRSSAASDVRPVDEALFPEDQLSFN
jgi:dCTP deaminase